ncbi:hypothetical protein GALMADRAFT_221103 [Galerina marginata CBS 339.88]|uniref:Uncharacterized protein n=1 Tax=Galerina marginata (strain CBS 339.88) TaxID=685588 RepID=A0A067TJ09_GALM3|nr:hypothetical protein GALMADRAFT_221103 [Galerina marginata CBS 339.88]
MSVPNPPGAPYLTERNFALSSVADDIGRRADSIASNAIADATTSVYEYTARALLALPSTARWSTLASIILGIEYSAGFALVDLHFCASRPNEFANLTV